jgi:hypothetical protein
LKFLNIQPEDLYLLHLNPNETDCVKVVVDQKTPLNKNGNQAICSKTPGK